jgi:hypothetical protein
MFKLGVSCAAFCTYAKCRRRTEFSTLRVALVEVPWKGAFSLAEAGRAEFELLGFVQLVTQCIQAFRVAVRHR